MKSDAEVIRREPTAVTQAGQEEGTMAGLLRLAIDKNLPVESLEKLVALNERIMDRHASEEFNAAMAAFQAECPPIARTSTANVATKSGARFSYKYAELDEIARTAGPLLHKYGLSFAWDSSMDKGILRCICTLRHSNGHSITASFECPTDSEAGMSPAQKYAAALTFARRQSLVSVLGLTNADPDTDGGEHHGTETITASQVADLAAMIDEVKADKPTFLKWMKVEKLAEIRQHDFKKAIDGLNLKRRKA